MFLWHKGAAPGVAACLVLFGCQPVHEGVGDYPDEDPTNSEDDVAEDSNDDSEDDGSTGSGSGGGEGTHGDSGSTGDDSTGEDSSGGGETGTGSEDGSGEDSTDGGTGEDSGETDSGSGGSEGDGSGEDSEDGDSGDGGSGDGGSSDEGSGDEDSDGGDPECPASTHRCIDEAPGGWSGPIAVHRGPVADPIPACVGAYGEDAFSNFSGLDPGAASCTCLCGDADAECERASANFRPLDSDCGGSPSPVHTLTNLSCYSLGETYNTGRWRTRNGSTTLADGGSCPSHIEETIPEPTWSAKIKGCGGAELIDGCSDDQVCAPMPVAPFEQRHCIYRAGDAECPDGIYSERIDGFTNYQDSRQCRGNCGCTAPEGECRTTIELFNGQCDNTPNAEIPVPGDCIPAAGAINNARLKFTPEATCEPTGEAEVTGEVELEGALTVCCTT